MALYLSVFNIQSCSLCYNCLIIDEEEERKAEEQVGERERTDSKRRSDTKMNFWTDFDKDKIPQRQNSLSLFFSNFPPRVIGTKE